MAKKQTKKWYKILFWILGIYFIIFMICLMCSFLLPSPYNNFFGETAISMTNIMPDLSFSSLIVFIIGLCIGILIERKNKNG